MSEARHVVQLLKTAPRADRVILLITLLLTVFADLVVAVNVGMILAILHFLRRMAETVETQPVAEAELSAELAQQGLPLLPPGVLVYEIAGPMFFGAVENFERALAHTHTEPRALVIRLRRVPFMDITGIETLKAVAGKLQARGVAVVLCEANDRVKTKLLRAGVIADGQAEGYADQLGAALRQVMPLEDAAGATAPA